MASLAILVAIIFVSVLLIGPMSYILSLFDWMPSTIVWIMGLLCILVGGWSMLVPVSLFKILGLVDLLIGFKIITDKREKKTEA
jgi:uncharacterized membrane protein